eukprot:6202419-Pleurochrysis_carterae.AAC.1
MGSAGLVLPSTPASWSTEVKTDAGIGGGGVVPRGWLASSPAASDRRAAPSQTALCGASS